MLRMRLQSRLRHLETLPGSDRSRLTRPSGRLANRRPPINPFPPAVVGAAPRAGCDVGAVRIAGELVAAVLPFLADVFNERLAVFRRYRGAHGTKGRSSSGHRFDLYLAHIRSHC